MCSHACFSSFDSPSIYENPQLSSCSEIVEAPSSSAMASRSLEITLISAKGLKEVNTLTKMAVYSVVSVSSDSRASQRTPPDREGGRNPSWNATVRLFVPSDLEHAGGHTLHILLRTERVLGDRDVGQVRVPLSELLAGAAAGPRPVQFVSYQVLRTGSGKPKGVLNFSYRFGERVETPPACYPPSSAYHATPALHPPQAAAYQSAPVSGTYPYGAPPPSKADEPVMAYPVGTSSPAYLAYGAAAAPYPGPQGYQQQQLPYGYGYPPGGYGYGYGAVPPRKNNFGMGLGAGLLGGALGGILIGDLVSDAGYGYDAGFDDDGGFGF